MPAGYLGPVIVSYKTPAISPLTYYVVSDLVVKVTATSLVSQA